MYRFAVAAAASLALAACSMGSDDGDTDGDGTVSAEEAERAVAKIRPLEAGQYKMSMEILELVDPAMNAKEIEQAKQFFASMSNAAPPRCLNEEEAKDGMLGIAETIQNGDCTVNSMTSDENGMRSSMTCESQGRPADVVLESTSTGTAADMTMTVTEGGDRADGKRMVMKVGMTRQGDCT